MPVELARPHYVWEHFQIACIITVSAQKLILQFHHAYFMLI